MKMKMWVVNFLLENYICMQYATTSYETLYCTVVILLYVASFGKIKGENEREMLGKLKLIYPLILLFMMLKDFPIVQH